MTKPTTPRLRELEAEILILAKDARTVDQYERLDSLSMEVHGYRTALEELWPVVEAARKAREAFEYTRQYVGYDLLPAIEGWSWYDADMALRDALAEVE